MFLLFSREQFIGFSERSVEKHCLRFNDVVDCISQYEYEELGALFILCTYRRGERGLAYGNR
jgi:hypothetical protein